MRVTRGTFVLGLLSPNNVGLSIKGIEDRLYEEIKRMAAEEGRSVSQQVLFLVKEYLARRHQMRRLKPPVHALLELSGSWQDERGAEEIIVDIKA